MGKKSKNDMDFDFDDNFDFEDPFASIDGEIEPGAKNSKKRSVIGDVFKGTVSGAKSKITDPEFIGKSVRNSLPPSYDTVFEGVDEVTTNVRKIYDQAVSELKPAVSAITSNIDRMVPESLGPVKSVTKKINGIFNKDKINSQISTESAENMAVSSAMSQVFGKMEARDDQRQARDEAEFKVSQAVDAKRFKSSSALMARIADNTGNILGMKQGVELDYQKKSLELQVRQLFTLQDLTTKSVRFQEAAVKQYEAIAKNTSLPEFVKLQESERFKEIAKNKFYGNIQGALYEKTGLGKIMERIKNDAGEYIGGIKQGLQGGADIAEMVREQLEQMNELKESGFDISKAEMAGQLAGGALTERMSNIFTSSIKQVLGETPEFNRIGYRESAKVLNPSAYAARLKEDPKYMDMEYETGAKGILGKVANYFLDKAFDARPDLEINRAGNVSDLKLPGVISNKFIRSVEEVIPSWLAYIHKELVHLRTDEDPGLASFDFRRNEIRTKKDRKASTTKKIESESDNFSHRFMVDKAYEELIGNAEVTDKQQEELKRFIMQISRDSKVYYDQKGIQGSKAYAGLSDEAKLIVDSSTDVASDDRDDEEKHKKVFDLTRSMIGARESTTDMRGFIEEEIRNGNLDILLDDGIVFYDRNDNLVINEKKYLEYVESGYFKTSDKNKKKDIKRVTSSRKRKRSKLFAKSDVTTKEDISPVATTDSLNKVRNTDIFTWKYKPGEGDGKQHIGPMAQDVRASMGDETAPSGKKIDLINLNGINMAATQELADRVDGLDFTGQFIGNKLSAIEANTLAISETLRDKRFFNIPVPKIDLKDIDLSKLDLSKIDFSKIDPRRFIPEGAMDRAKKIAKAGYNESISLAGKGYNAGKSAVGGLYNAAKETAKWTKEVTVDPLINYLKKDETKQKISETFGKAFTNTLKLGNALVGQVNKTVFERIPKAVEFVKDKASNLMKTFYDGVIGPVDMYIKGKPDEPVIRASRLRAGDYFDSATSTVLKTLRDIESSKGDIVDREGNIVVSVKELSEGLFDKFGKQLKRKGVNLLQAGLNLGGRAIGGAMRLAAKGGQKVASFLGLNDGRFEEFQQNLKESMTDAFGELNIAGFSSASNEAIADIRDLLYRVYPNEALSVEEDKKLKRGDPKGRNKGLVSSLKKFLGFGKKEDKDDSGTEEKDAAMSSGSSSASSDAAPAGDSGVPARSGSGAISGLLNGAKDFVTGQVDKLKAKSPEAAKQIEENKDKVKSFVSSKVDKVKEIFKPKAAQEFVGPQQPTSNTSQETVSPNLAGLADNAKKMFGGLYDKFTKALEVEPSTAKAEIKPSEVATGKTKSEIIKDKLTEFVNDFSDKTSKQDPAGGFKDLFKKMQSYLVDKKVISTEETPEESIEQEAEPIGKIAKFKKDFKTGYNRKMAELKAARNKIDQPETEEDSQEQEDQPSTFMDRARKAVKDAGKIGKSSMKIGALPFKVGGKAVSAGVGTVLELLGYEPKQIAQAAEGFTEGSATGKGLLSRFSEVAKNKGRDLRNKALWAKAEIGDTLDGYTNKAKEKYDTVKDAVSQKYQQVKDKASQTGRDFYNKALWAKAEAMDTIDPYIQRAKEGYEQGKEFVANKYQSAKDKASEVGRDIYNKATWAKAELQDSLDPYVQKAKDKYAGLKDKASAFGRDIANKAMFTKAQIGDELADKLNPVKEKVSSTFSRAKDIFNRRMGTTVEDAKETYATEKDKIRSVLSEYRKDKPQQEQQDKIAENIAKEAPKETSDDKATEAEVIKKGPFFALAKFGKSINGLKEALIEKAKPKNKIDDESEQETEEDSEETQNTESDKPSSKKGPVRKRKGQRNSRAVAKKEREKKRTLAPTVVVTQPAAVQPADTKKLDKGQAAIQASQPQPQPVAQQEQQSSGSGLVGGLLSKIPGGNKVGGLYNRVANSRIGQGLGSALGAVGSMAGGAFKALLGTAASKVDTGAEAQEGRDVAAYNGALSSDTSKGPTFNDKDGNGRREGSAEDRMAAFEAEKRERLKRKKLERGQAKYQSGTNVIDKMIGAAQGIVDNVKSIGAGLMEAAGGIFGGDGKGSRRGPVGTKGPKGGKVGKLSKLKSLFTFGKTAGAAGAAGTASTVAGSAAKTAASTAAKGGLLKSMGSKLPGLGTAVALGMGAMDVYASESSDMSRDEKDLATGEAVGSTGGAIAGMAVGAKAGAAIGTVLGPVGTGVGALVGGAVGGIAGSSYGAKAGAWLGSKVTSIRKFFGSKAVSDIDLIRMYQYGIGHTEVSKEYFGKIQELESYLEDGRVGYKIDQAHLLEKKMTNEELLDIMDIDPKNKVEVTKFTEWFIQRFTPVFLHHNTLIYSIDNKIEMSKLNTMDDTKKKKYLEKAAFESAPWHVTVSPFKNVPSLLADRNYSIKLTEKLRIGLTKDSDKKTIAPATVIKPKEDTQQASKIEKQGQKEQELEAKNIQAKNAATSSGPGNSNLFPSATVGAAKQDAGESMGEDGPQQELGKAKAPAKTTSEGAKSPTNIAIAPGSLKPGDEGMKYVAFNKPTVSIDSMNPVMKQQLLGMIQEYGELTGKKVILTSGTRSTQEQERLYRQNPAKAARPGRSLHEFGVAVDINSADVDALDKLGLMRKYGFTRPVGGETWHVEPAGIQGQLTTAKKDPNAASSLIASGVGLGGGGIGSVRGSAMGKRDPEAAKTMIAATSKQVDPVKEVAKVTGEPAVPEQMSKVDTLLAEMESNPPAATSASASSSAIDRAFAHLPAKGEDSSVHNESLGAAMSKEDADKMHANAATWNNSAAPDSNAALKKAQSRSQEAADKSTDKLWKQMQGIYDEPEEQQPISSALSQVNAKSTPGTNYRPRVQGFTPITINSNKIGPSLSTSGNAVETIPEISKSSGSSFKPPSAGNVPAMGGGQGLNPNTAPAGKSPGNAGQGMGITDIIEEGAKKANMDPEMMKAFAAIESSMNPNASAKTSSAKGLFQFLNATWQEQVEKHGKKYGLAPGVSQFDPYASTVIAAEYLKSNLNRIKSVKPDQNIVDAYLTHFLGAGGAKTFLSQPADALAAPVMRDAANANKSIFYAGGGRSRTFGEIYEMFRKKIENKSKAFGINVDLGKGMTSAGKTDTQKNVDKVTESTGTLTASNYSGHTAMPEQQMAQGLSPNGNTGAAPAQPKTVEEVNNLKMNAMFKPSAGTKPESKFPGLVTTSAKTDNVIQSANDPVKSFTKFDPLAKDDSGTAYDPSRSSPNSEIGMNKLIDINQQQLDIAKQLLEFMKQELPKLTTPKPEETRSSNIGPRIQDVKNQQGAGAMGGPGGIGKLPPPEINVGRRPLTT